MRKISRRKKKVVAATLAGAAGSVLLLAVAAWLAAPFLTPSLESRDPKLPSVVWSRPATLDPALPLTRKEVLAMLERRGYVEAAPPAAAGREPDGQPEAGTLLDGRFRRANGGLRIARRGFSTGDLQAPADVLLLSFDPGGRLDGIEDARGNRLARAELEPEALGRLYGSYWHDRLPVTLDELPDHLLTAILEVEDRRFHEHGGLDSWRIAGAFVANVRAGRTVQGGSTITQQLVKNLWLTSERSFARKAKEAWFAIGLERRESKERILEAYVNEVYLGQRGPVAIHGVGQAAHHYLGKHPRDLTLAESAFLAGMIQAPGRHSPHRDLDGAAGRRDVVLGILRDRERVTEEDYRAALEERLAVRPAPRFGEKAPYVEALVRRSLAEQFSADDLESRGLDVHTTIDARLQRIATRAVERHLADLERRFPRLKRPDAPLQAAAVVLTPHSGEILALVGGRDWKTSQFDRATQARRQPGSTFKPVVALAALTAGDLDPRITLATTLEDEPLEIPTRDGLWRPVNHDGEFLGTVTLREALKFSRNVPMVRLGQRIGAARIVSTARRLGIESALDPVPSLPLGSSPVTPLELTQAYAVLASEGLYTRPTALHAVRAPTGRLAWFHGRDVETRFTPAEAFLVSSVLENAAAPTMARLGWTGPVAGKTGTSDDGRDLWFVGYTPDLVIGVWVGFDDGAATALYGASGAAPIFAAIARDALGSADRHAPAAPAGVVRERINRRTGALAGFGCSGDPEWFLEGTAPTRRCGIRLLDDLKRLFGS